MLKKLPVVADHMDTVVPTLTPSTEIHSAVAFLLANKVTGAPVVDNQRHLLGILTEYDCLRILSVGADADVPSGTVADYMTEQVTTITPNTDIYYTAGLFLANRFRRLPVVDGDGKLVGAVTRFDLLRVIRDVINAELG